jgi:hypothetical protein
LKSNPAKTSGYTQRNNYKSMPPHPMFTDEFNIIARKEIDTKQPAPLPK